MGQCHSSCCPLHGRSSKATNGHPVTGLSSDPALFGHKLQEPTSTTRCHIPLEHGDISGGKYADCHRSGGHSRHVSESKVYVELTRPHSDCHSGEKKQLTGPADAALEANVLFERYRDLSEADCIAVGGLERLCIDLGLEPDDFLVLLLAWQCGAETMCRLTQTEFVAGCRVLNATTIDAILARLKDIAVDVRRDKNKFRDLYRWAYGFALDASVLQRSLPVDIAVAMWRLVFEGAEDLPKVLPRWLEFLEKRDDLHSIPRDTWDMFLVFVTKIGDDLDTYDESEAWPTLLDDFVEYENDRQNQNLYLDVLDKETAA